MSVRRKLLLAWVFPGREGERVSQVRTVSAVAGKMNRLADWLAEHQVSHVVMEATGQYWELVWDVLAKKGFELMMVNALRVKMVPGRKTDVADATRLAELLEHGLPRGSFVPPRPIRELRDLTRYHKGWSKHTPVKVSASPRSSKMLG